MNIKLYLKYQMNNIRLLSNTKKDIKAFIEKLKFVKENGLDVKIIKIIIGIF